MASGILGQAAPAAATNTTVYTVPSATTAVVTISITNTTGYPTVFNLAVASTATPTSSEYIEFQTVLPGYGVFERSGVVAGPAEQFVVNATNVGTSVSIYGYEEV
jgi:hypothetical protein